MLHTHAQTQKSKPCLCATRREWRQHALGMNIALQGCVAKALQVHEQGMVSAWSMHGKGSARAADESTKMHVITMAWQEKCKGIGKAWQRHHKGMTRAWQQKQKHEQITLKNIVEPTYNLC